MIEELRAQAYLPLLTLHGVWRWAVLAAAVVVVGAALQALVAKRPWSGLVVRSSKLFVLTIDLQLVLGLALFVFASPVARAVFQPGAPPEALYFGLVHFLAMLAVVVIAHAGNVAIKRADTATLRARRAAIFFAPCLLILLAATPWWRPLLRL